MPKVSSSLLPLSALFAVNKPSGPTSMSVVNDIKALIEQSKLFVAQEKLDAAGKKKGKKGKRKRASDYVKIGQGGTLDPLADGVLVVGIGRGTKKLSEFLDCVKEYETTCVLGCETDTYDSEGAAVRTAPWRHVTREKVEEALSLFRGEIKQTPPIFSALKMDGYPLHHYARKGIKLPRPIEKRDVTVHSLELTEWKGSEHQYRWPEKKFTDEERHAMEEALKGVEAPEDVKIEDDPQTESVADQAPTAFVLKMKVSGGTYVRSIVHDLGHAVGSAAHVVTLTRLAQGRFTLHPEGEGQLGCVPWKAFADATAEGEGEADSEGWHEWERQVIDHMEIVADNKS